ncbi:MAG: hypothetical protein E6Q83_00700 [Thiothrix sp.]|nr:MAG: hypothetical protein E6Q83_00700 [Thiothrix sp.]
MYFLRNQNLQVELLDPVADQPKFGVRYCTGGYIYQIIDERHGNLLSGPTYPDSFNWFDGQGIPDAFNWTPLRAARQDDSEVLVVGVGICDLLHKQVKSFCAWQIEQTEQQIIFTTEQVFADYALRLVRSVFLNGRTLRSQTELSNLGAAFIPISWFPHPFFPQPQTSEDLCQLNMPVQLKEDNLGYRLAPNGFIQRKALPTQNGYYLALDYQAQQPLSILQRHDQLGLIGATCSYVPTYLPIWGNQRTFSCEPFFQTIVAPGHSSSWWIDYHF